MIIDGKEFVTYIKGLNISDEIVNRKRFTSHLNFINKLTSKIVNNIYKSLSNEKKYEIINYISDKFVEDIIYKKPAIKKHFSYEGINMIYLFFNIVDDPFFMKNYIEEFIVDFVVNKYKKYIKLYANYYYIYKISDFYFKPQIRKNVFIKKIKPNMDEKAFEIFEKMYYFDEKSNLYKFNSKAKKNMFQGDIEYLKTIFIKSGFYHKKHVVEYTDDFEVVKDVPYIEEKHDLVDNNINKYEIIKKVLLNYLKEKELLLYEIYVQTIDYESNKVGKKRYRIRDKEKIDYLHKTAEKIYGKKLTKNYFYVIISNIKKKVKENQKDIIKNLQEYNIAL